MLKLGVRKKNMESNITIYDIAKKLKITAATVSRALSDNPRISKSTKELVLKTAKDMNYRPNRLAAALKNGKSKTVGVVLPYINKNFFSTVIRGIEEELYPEGYNVIICQTHESVDRERETLKTLMKSQVDGVIISVARYSQDWDHLEEVIKKGIPLIFFDRRVTSITASSITIDDFKGSYDATKHLIQQGRRRIAHLTVDLLLEIYKNRLEGYKLALKEAKIPFDEKLVVVLRSDIAEGKKAAEHLMSLQNPPDAIVSASDHGALGAINWLKSEGYKIPRDISVVGFSNEPFTQFMEMPISSIDQKPLEMGKKAASIFLKQLKDNNSDVENIVIEPELMIRASSILK